MQHEPRFLEYVQQLMFLRAMLLSAELLNSNFNFNSNYNDNDNDNDNDLEHSSWVYVPGVSH